MPFVPKYIGRTASFIGNKLFGFIQPMPHRGSYKLGTGFQEHIFIGTFVFTIRNRIVSSKIRLTVLEFRNILYIALIVQHNRLQAIEKF